MTCVWRTIRQAGLYRETPSFVLAILVEGSIQKFHHFAFGINCGCHLVKSLSVYFLLSVG